MAGEVLRAQGLIDLFEYSFTWHMKSFNLSNYLLISYSPRAYTQCYEYSQFLPMDRIEAAYATAI